jgi:hypothetical protein
MGMKRIGIKTGLLIFLYLLSATGMAQEKEIFDKNYAGLTITQLPFLDYRISYERRITPKRGIKMEIGYKPAFKYFTDATIINLGHNATGWAYRNTADWYYVSLGYRYYFNAKRTIYFSPEVFYKLMKADNIIYSYGGINHSEWFTNYFELRSMHTDCFGLNGLVGTSVMARSSKLFILHIDTFTGLSLRYKSSSTTIYGHTEVGHYYDSSVGTVYIPISDEPQKIEKRFVQLMLQFGMVLFISWK